MLGWVGLDRFLNLCCCCHDRCFFHVGIVSRVGVEGSRGECSRTAVCARMFLRGLEVSWDEIEEGWSLSCKKS